jgi:capsular polysaccharide biosynthesis protein
LWNELQKKGFNKFKLSEMNFEDQVGLFFNAEVIVSSHGAGLANILFCKPKTKIIEVKHKRENNPLYFNISKVLDLDHSTCDVENKKDYQEEVGIYMSKDDINHLLKKISC